MINKFLCFIGFHDIIGAGHYNKEFDYKWCQRCRILVLEYRYDYIFKEIINKIFKRRKI
jgi:hypothetical protein